MRGVAPTWQCLLALALAATPVAACRAETAAPAKAEQGTAPLELTGRVVDAANILPPDVESGLVARSAALEQATGVQFVVVSTPSLGGRDIGQYATALGNGWGIGHKDRDDGLILLVAPNDREVRISTGLGLEKKVTDIECQKIIEIMLVNFRKGDIAGGVAIGAELLDRLVRIKSGLKA